VRESQQSNAPSLLGGLSHRASLLWPGKKPQSPTHRNSLGTHVPLGSQENISTVHMQNLNASPTPSPLGSPSPTPTKPSGLDPFNNSSAEAGPSPFDDPQRVDSPNSSQDRQDVVSSLSRSGSGLRKPPPPRPLDLPPPRTPPVLVDGQPAPRDTPTPTLHTEREPESPKEVRWWHDWLCGCNEGPDRGGDHQVCNKRLALAIRWIINVTPCAVWPYQSERIRR
jgi:hypothetical protein